MTDMAILDYYWLFQFHFFVSWRILEANNEEQIDTRAYTKNICGNHVINITQNTTHFIVQGSSKGFCSLFACKGFQNDKFNVGCRID